MTDTMTEAEYAAWQDALRLNEPLVTPRERAKQIVAEIAARHDLTVDQIMTRTHRHDRAHARWDAYARIRAELKWSLPVIGRFFNKHHTTILYGLRQREITA